MVYIFLANGFEELEALAPYDILKRAGEKVILCGVGSKEITSARGLKVITDITEDEIELNEELKLVVLPGGLPGADNLYNSEYVKKAVMYAYENAHISAICASPYIFAKWGLIDDKKATVYPDKEYIKLLKNYTSEAVVTDKNVTTANGPGAAVEFSLELVRILCSNEKAEQILNAMQCK